MKAPLQIVICSLTFLLATTAEAQILKCVGVDNTGATLNVKFNSDPKAQSLNVNGVTHKIEAPTKDRTGLATENFATDKNVIVYDSFIKDSDGKYRLHRFNGMTDETIFNVELVCKVLQ